MTIKEAQQIVDNWIKEYGVRYFDEKTNTLVLVEEVGEFARLIARKYGEQSFKKALTEQQVDHQIEEELADIFFVLICLANQMGIELDEVFINSINKKTQRDKDRHIGNNKLE
jgi:NTP pyrophosphatase (non-canonical NTP hydrolase)